jgi:hypothetical protein
MSIQPTRHFPVHPNLVQLKRQAKDYLKALRATDPSTVAEFEATRRNAVPPETARLTDVQYVLARSYGLSSWPRLVLACQMADAIWANDVHGLQSLLAKHPKLLNESVRGLQCNWGAPLAYAATVGRPDVIAFLSGLGPKDVQHAFERACLKGWTGIARTLLEQGAKPVPGSVMGPCETLNAEGLAFQLGIGAPFSDANGSQLAPLAMILQTYCRDPKGKHGCLEIVARHGIELPDTPPMALHRGRIDLLARHLEKDPSLFTRTFAHAEIFPPSLGCGPDPAEALFGAPLDGTTLLHLCMDYDEFEIAQWILERGGPVDVPAEIDKDGFGGHTALFGCIISQPYRTGRGNSTKLPQLLLDHGANVNHRASIRKAHRFVEDESLHEYRDVTPRALGERYHDQDWVNKPALELIVKWGAIY